MRIRKEINIRDQFPILSQRVNGKVLTYLDNASTSQKPIGVLEALNQYYSKNNAWAGPGGHELSNRATQVQESGRQSVARMINAISGSEIIGTSSTSEGIQKIADLMGKEFLQPGDEIILSEMEHQSNIIPWVQLQESLGIKLKFIPVDDKGQLDINVYKRQLSLKTKLVSVCHISNCTGMINPVEEITYLARKKGSLSLIDAAQSIVHEVIDIKKLDCDFLVFNSHKAYGPADFGILYGKEQVLEQFRWKPKSGEREFSQGPGFVGLGSAFDFLNSIGMEEIKKHERSVMEYAIKELAQLAGFQPVGRLNPNSPIISFVLDGFHPSDVGDLLNDRGIAVRTGFHHSPRLLRKLNIRHGSVRVSFSVYNDFNDVDRLVSGIRDVISKYGY